MGKRLKIGINYNYNRNWMGGTYYVENLIHSLNSLEDSLKPELLVVTRSKDHFERIYNIGYPYVTNLNYGQLQKGINRISRLFIGRNIIHHRKFKILDAIFPVFDNQFIGNLSNVIYWIPDFQEKYLPQFFSNSEVKARTKHQNFIAKNKTNIIFSSEDATNDYARFFPKAVGKSNVLNFAVFHPNLSKLNAEEVRIKYRLPVKFFIVPNQFWAHKNHISVLKAISILKKKNIEIHIAFTGKQIDTRNPLYFQELEEYISDESILDQISFLGFIDRKDQLCLMKQATAIIQPSYFEGWSTVIEDGKALNNYIVASSLSVNKEQLSQNAQFFDPNDSDSLANILTRLLTTKPKIVQNIYSKAQRKFGTEFLRIIQNIKDNKHV